MKKTVIVLLCMVLMLTLMVPVVATTLAEKTITPKQENQALFGDCTTDTDINDAHSRTQPLMMQLCSTAETRKPEFEPTDEEKAAAESMKQSGIISYDAVADTDASSGIFMTAAIIVAAIAVAVLIFTVIVLVTRNKRS